MSSLWASIDSEFLDPRTDKHAARTAVRFIPGDRRHQDVPKTIGKRGMKDIARKLTLNTFRNRQRAQGLSLLTPPDATDPLKSGSPFVTKLLAKPVELRTV